MTVFMIILLLVLALLVAVAAVIFALGNPGIITLTFLLWEVESSLTLVVLVAFALGALAATLVLLPGTIRHRLRAASRGKTISDLEKRIAETKDKKQNVEAKTGE